MNSKQRKLNKNAARRVRVKQKAQARREYLRSEKRYEEAVASLEGSPVGSEELSDEVADVEVGVAQVEAVKELLNLPASSDIRRLEGDAAVKAVKAMLDQESGSAGKL